MTSTLLVKKDHGGRGCRSGQRLRVVYSVQGLHLNIQSTADDRLEILGR